MAKKGNNQNNSRTERDLTPQQDLFCQEYIKDFNAGKAAQRAKYSKKTAYSKGPQLLKKIEILERIEYYKKQHLLNADITAEQIINEWKILAFSDLTDVFKGNQDFVSLQEIKKLPGAVKRAIKSFEMGKDGIKIKFHSKEKALEVLGRYQGLEKLYLDGDLKLKTDNELIIKVVQVGNGATPPKVKQ